MKKILLIGGAGTWSGLAYIPSIKQANSEVTLVAILDPTNPYYSSKTISHYDYLTTNNVKWIKSGKNCDEELVKRVILENDIDIVIISTPPKYHYDYTLASLKYGVDVICDKPIIVTEAQSSSVESSLSNIEKHQNLIKAINESHNKKADRRCFVLTPLRRKVQETYTNIYDSVQQIKGEFGQELTNLMISHNDGVFRFDDEVELKRGSHGYSEGFGKLTHTGYHILDVVAGLIMFGCDFQNIQCVCKIINCNTVGDMLKSNSNKINKKLLYTNPKPVKLSNIALEAEMDITICYTLYHNNEKFCNIIVDLIHCGKSNRTLSHYDFNNYNDQGRTNELTLHLQQGSLFSSQMIISTMAGSNGTIGNGYTFKTFHPKVSKRIQEDSIQVLNFKNQSFENTIDIISKFYSKICTGNLDGYYLYTDFLNQIITDELYISALIAKTIQGGEFKWKLGEIKLPNNE